MREISMGREKVADKLRNEAYDLFTSSDQEKALELFLKVMREYQDTWTVDSLVCDDVRMVAEIVKNWDAAIEACKVSAKLRPEDQIYYQAMIKEYQLDKKGKHIEAVEARVRRAKTPPKHFKGKQKDFVPPYGEILGYADIFLKLGANDRAWGLYNEATTYAVRNGVSPHSVYKAMGDILLKEQKPLQALELFLVAICEAKRWTEKHEYPKSLVNSLNRALSAAGIKERGFGQQVADMAATKGNDQAYSMVKKRLANEI
jgi:tetratricopeptide (TPR) repeat protein